MFNQSTCFVVATTLIISISSSTVRANDAFLNPIGNIADSFLGTTEQNHPAGHSHHSLNRVDTHAPAGLMGDHMHAKGEMMVEYKYMNMAMHGTQQGRTPISASAIFNNNFLMAPHSMHMEMHMIHYMWAPNDKMTLYVMPTVRVNTMNMKFLDVPAGSEAPVLTNHRTHNHGFGDLPFGSLIKLHETKRDELILNIGFSAPTGDIDNRTMNMKGEMLVEFPYWMRLGKGSWAARPGLTYKRYAEKGSLGIQFQSDIVLGSNSEGYSASDDYRLNAWLTRCLDAEKTLAGSFRVEADWRSNIRGQDGDLMRIASPSNQPHFQGGDYINFGYGIMKTVRGGSRLNFEIAHPIYQDLEGIQMATDWNLAASWSTSF